MKTLIMLITVLLLAGCGANQTATQQIIDQDGGKLEISKAAYLDARTWYNDAQENFIRHIPAMTPDEIQQHNELLDKCGAALDQWGLALALGNLDAGDPSAFRKARQELIDAGIMLLAD